MKFFLSLLLSFFVLYGVAFAVEPDEVMADPALEQRAREVSKELRCVVCQNQSIDDSDSGIAKKMRLLVRDRIAKGDTNQEVIDYLVSRYGDFVLLNPPFKAKTLILWVGPFVMFLVGLVGIFFFYRKKSKESEETTKLEPLNAEEQARLEKLLKNEGSET